jgi:hypothetical protein
MELLRGAITLVSVAALIAAFVFGIRSFAGPRPRTGWTAASEFPDRDAFQKAITGQLTLKYRIEAPPARLSTPGRSGFRAGYMPGMNVMKAAWEQIVYSGSK